MDSVRFGRALGVGARAAAKTLVTAVDAATAANPSAGEGARRSAAAPGTTASSKASGVRLGDQAARTATQVRQTRQGLKEGGKRFGEAMGGRLVRLWGALWLEITGFFFGIFAVSAATGSWRMRAALHETAGNHDAHVRFLISVTMAAVFGYFCVSSFVKASRRTNGR